MMRAMVLSQPGQPLQLQMLPKPVAGPGQLLLKVTACGICRTDLHVLDPVRRREIPERPVA